MLSKLETNLSPIAMPTSRRHFLFGTAAVAGGLMVGLKVSPASAASEAEAAKEIANPLTGYIHITPDNKVTVLSSQFDMGQGPYHGLATLVVEELGADWSQIEVIGAAGNPKLYGNLMWGGTIQGTGGSTSMATSFDRYRQAGAVAREMLVAAAAKDWGVPGPEITVAGGKLSHSGKSANFGEMAKLAATMPVPQDVLLKEEAAWTEIGNASRRRHDSPPKANGTHQFTIDLKLDGMLTAVIAHPPKFGAKVKSFDGAEALRVRGVSDVVEIHRGVAVVADNMWSAIKGREALKVTWDEAAAETRGSADMIADYRTRADQAPQAMARTDGDTAKALASAAKVIEATYEFPFLAHAAMEPLNAVARRNADGTLEVWGGHQMPDVYQAISAQISGIKPENITMHVMKTGGGFGRRAVPDGDVVSEAVAVAKAIDFKAPVKVQWTREDDMHGGRYRPAYVHRFKAGLDADGKLIAWDNHIIGQSIITGTPFEAGFVKDGVDATSVEGATNIPYGIPNVSVGLTTSDVKVPVLWWRAVGSTHTAYAVETFLDEVISAAGKDPYAFRMELLDEHPRHAAVLQLAAEKAGWDTPAPEGRFRGLAVHESFNSVVAHIAEVSMENGEPKVHKVTVAVDCGIAVNPDTIRAQMEGGTGFGLGSIMAEELTLVNGEVQQGNYDTYTPLRIDAMPDIEVHIVPSSNAPTGVGEPGVPSIGPAVANAIAAASGRRIRVLPMAKSIGA